MKKLALATAIAAATVISTGAHAAVRSTPPSAPFLSGNIQMWATGFGFDMEVDCASTTHPDFTTSLRITGVDPTLITLKGEVCLDPNLNGTPYVGLVLSLAGAATTSAPFGTIFNAGNIDIFTDFGSGWIYAYTVDVSLSPVDCTTAIGTGLQWTGTPGTNTLPGPAAPTPTPTNAVCSASLLSTPVTLHLTGANSW